MRTTINFHDSTYRALKIRAAESNSSIGSLVEEAVINQLLEDAEDIEDAAKRASESVLSFDELVAQFKAEGLL